MNIVMNTICTTYQWEEIKATDHFQNIGIDRDNIKIDMEKYGANVFVCGFN